MNQLAIVTVTYNNYEQLVDTTNSLKLIPRYHHIIINGGACEKTKKFLIEQKIDHISEPDKGICDAFNKGICKFFESDSKYIIFINSGDRIANASYVEKAIDFLEQNQECAFTYGDVIIQDSSMGNRYIQAPNPINYGRGMPCHQTIIYRRNVFERVGWFDLSYKIAMDYQHLGRMLQMGLWGHYITAPSPVFFDGEGISSTQRMATLKEMIRALFDTGMVYENKRGSIRFLLWSLLIEILIILGIKEVLTKKLNLFRYRMPLPPSADFTSSPVKTYVIIFNAYKNTTVSQIVIPPDVEWVFFCQKDECLLEGYVDKLFEIVECCPWVEVVVSGAICEDGHYLGGLREESRVAINKFNHAKFLVDSHFAVKAETFKKLNGFDERFEEGSVSALDFIWRAHFKKIPMLYCSELKAFRAKSYECPVTDGFRRAIVREKNRGTLIAKWFFEEKKLKPLGELLDVTTIYTKLILKYLLTGAFRKTSLSFVALLACHWGFLVSIFR